jgi:hypothetical protein
VSDAPSKKSANFPSRSSFLQSPVVSLSPRFVHRISEKVQEGTTCEIQTLFVTASSPVAGYFRVSHPNNGDIWTDYLPYNVSAFELEAVLEESFFDDVEVSHSQINVAQLEHVYDSGLGEWVERLTAGYVGKGSGNAWDVTFLSDAGNVQPIIGDASMLTSEAHSDMSVYTVEKVSATSETLNGQFKLSFGGEETDFLNYDCSDTELEDALNGLPTIGRVAVDRTGPTSNNNGYQWFVTFLAPDDVPTELQHRGDVPSIVPISGSLTGTMKNIAVHEAIRGSYLDGTFFSDVRRFEHRWDSHFLDTKSGTTSI